MLMNKVEGILLKDGKNMKTLQFAMNLPKLNTQYTYSTTTPNQQFHSASVGKLMTATLIFKAIEMGMITLETRINKILADEILDRLFMFKGIDYKNEVTVEHLLGHTSGVNDYFGSKSFDGALFIDNVIKYPDKFWTPMDLINYTRTKQSAVGIPGKQLHYSDTGYVLLGLIVEAVYGMPFYKALDSHIFLPTGMKETTLCFYSDHFNQESLAPLYINNTDVHGFRSLSCDFSGGGLSTTTGDLLLFLDQLQHNRYIDHSSLNKMADFAYRYRQGMMYGLGMMQLRFEQFFPLLKSLPRLQGHLGVTGVHAWYDPDSEATYVMNVGNTKDMIKSFKILIKILQLVKQATK